MNFFIGIVTGIIAMAALIEWRSGYYSEMIKYYHWTFSEKLKKKETNNDTSKS